MDKDNPTQVGRALAQLGIELIHSSERMFGTLQKRLPQELRLAGIATMAEANRFLEELFWPAHRVFGSDYFGLTRIARKSLTLVRVGPGMTKSPRGAKNP